MNPINFLKRLRFRLFYAWMTKSNVPLVTLGDTCQWTFCDTNLKAHSKVLCAGAGHDISFEKALIQAYGCRVILLDPSPTGTTTVTKEKIPQVQLCFIPMGLARLDGFAGFHEPNDLNEGSFRAGKDVAAGTLRFPCKSLSTLMSEVGWQQIDLLKIDIEGSEYGVIQDILENNLDVAQICVEFHYGNSFGYTRNEMIGSIRALRRAGYHLVHHINRDHTFLRC